MKNRFLIGFIGFGEAGFEIARGLHSSGVAAVCLCDVAVQDPERALLIKNRAREAGAVILGTIGEVVEQSATLLSLVPPEVSVTVAKEAAPHLQAGRLYIDLTSSFPDEMKRIAAFMEPSGALFVDGAMMGALPVYGHKVLIYVAGRHAGEASRILNAYGMNLKVVGEEPGQASAIKLILSVATKGFGGLLVEMLLASHHYQVEESVLFALNQFFAKGLDAAVDRFVGSDAVHAGRRIKEMESSVRLLENIGIDPMMTQATVQRLKWSASLNLADYFGGITPEGYKDVIQAWEEKGLFRRSEQRNRRGRGDHQEE
jgi:3-hydroxyisobutyrate dehydrogenase-like beta-hydroxyacid dehydrogenase